MDLKKAIAGRRSIRYFLDEPVAEEDIREMVSLGTMAPNSGNNQDWRFLAITNRETKERMKTLLQDKLVSLATRSGKENPERYGQHHNSILFAGAPLALAILTIPYRSRLDGLLQLCGYAEAEIDYLRMRPDLQTVGAVAQTILLAAHSMNYGGCWMVAPNLARHDMEQLLGVVPPWSLAALLAIGKPAREAGNKKMKPLDDVLEIRG